jgi:hypothetical protein
MRKLHHSMFVSGVLAIAAAGFLVGCSSDGETRQPSETGGASGSGSTGDDD